MPAALLHPDEAIRLAALARYQILDTEAEAAFDDLAKLAAYICQAPVALISFVDAERQWFKARVGTEITETPREAAICNQTIQQDHLLVPDLAADARFASLPCVQASPHCRFYAGVTLYSEDQQAVGTLCVLDVQVRAFTPQQFNALQCLGRQVVSQLELRRRVTQLLRISQVKTKLLATLSHDIKSPFSGVLGFAEILRDEAGALSVDELREFANNIHAMSRQVLFLLDNVLQWARLELDHLAFRPGKLRLIKTAQEVETLIQGLILRKQQRLVIEIPPATLVVADLNMLTSVLLNLLNNAVKFTPLGGVVKLSVAPTTADLLQVTVSDTGVGMTSECVASLFDRETRLSTRSTTGERGTGLGLLLCKEFIERQGGRIWAESHLGVGSAFHFTLPSGAVN
jgi:signal transduction histidine kinase